MVPPLFNKSKIRRGEEDVNAITINEAVFSEVRTNIRNEIEDDVAKSALPKDIVSVAVRLPEASRTLATSVIYCFNQ